jgi:methylase of polypeptide subunit release factors
MANESILSLIEAEIAKLQSVRALLANTGKAVAKANKLVERTSKKAVSAAKGQPKTKAKAKKQRVLSPEARKRIADAQRRRWAAQKAKS